MGITHIDSNKIQRMPMRGAGEFAEILNNQLCGAKNMAASLHWLRPGDHLDVQCDQNTHQLFYLMEGEAAIILNSQEHRVAKGGGLYLGPSESANIRHAGAGPLKLFHLVVPKLPQ